MPDEPHTRSPRDRLVAPGAIDHHVADMTATASADVTLGALQSQLARHEQWLPIDGDADAPLGRLVEHNSTGPLRLGYGAWRDLLLGVQFRNGPNELITAGGRTMKNVAGYDMTKFMVGQGGIFGRVETLTVRTYRRPTGAILLRVEPDVRILQSILPTDLRPQWAILSADALLLGYLADAKTLTYYAERLKALRPKALLRRTLQEDAEHRAALWCCVGEMLLRAAVPPARLSEFVSAARPVSWAADAAFGVVLGSCERAACQRIQSAASAVGGSVFFRTPEGLPFDVTIGPAERKLLERLKQAFDPDGVLPPLPWSTT